MLKLKLMKKIQISQYGDAASLTLVESDIPIPKSNEVLIKVVAAGVNFIDTYQRAGVPNYQQIGRASCRERV